MTREKFLEILSLAVQLSDRIEWCELHGVSETRADLTKVTRSPKFIYQLRGGLFNFAKLTDAQLDSIPDHQHENLLVAVGFVQAASKAVLCSVLNPPGKVLMTMKFQNIAAIFTQSDLGTPVASMEEQITSQKTIFN